MCPLLGEHFGRFLSRKMVSGAGYGGGTLSGTPLVSCERDLPTPALRDAA